MSGQPRQKDALTVSIILIPATAWLLFQHGPLGFLGYAYLVNFETLRIVALTESRSRDIYDQSELRF